MSSTGLSSQLWESSDLYRNSITQLEDAARTMKLDPNIAERLKVPKRALIVSVPIRLDDGSIKVFEGYRVQQSLRIELFLVLFVVVLGTFGPNIEVEKNF
jgi:hypothetical protein